MSLTLEDKTDCQTDIQLMLRRPLMTHADQCLTSPVRSHQHSVIINLLEHDWRSPPRAGEATIRRLQSRGWIGASSGAMVRLDGAEDCVLDG